MTGKTRTVAVLACALALGACSGSSGHGGAPASSSASTSTPPNGEATCTPTIGAGTHTVMMSIGGHDRTVIVHAPSAATSSAARPLVLDLHGSGSTAAGQEVFSGMDATADADGFVVAYPQAVIPDGPGFDWNVPGVPLIGGRAVPTDAADDVAFLTTVVARLHTAACIDPTRVYATGMSGGARLSSQLACDASTTFAAVAPVSGLRFPSPCPATRAVPVIAFHGTADPVDPYDGNGQPYWTYSVPVAAQRWAAHDGCRAPASTTHPAGTVTLTSYSGCTDGAAVELYTIGGEGHEWPGGPVMPRAEVRLLGAQTRAVDADAVMWRFFVSHPLPRAGA